MEQAIAAQYGPPVGRMKALLQFNKVNGALTMVLTALDPSTLNQEYYTYVETEFDFENDKVVSKVDNTKPGTVNDWVVMAKADLPQEVYEEQLDSLARDKITKLYPVIQQVNLVGKAVVALDENIVAVGQRLDKIIELLGESKEHPPLLLQSVVGDLVEMQSYIAEVKQANALRKEYFKESDAHVFISSEDAQAQLDAVLEGGVHEAFGARPSQGGRVF